MTGIVFYNKSPEEMIYGESLSFEELIKRIATLKVTVNNIYWAY
jgi:hypothetical protein